MWGPTFADETFGRIAKDFVLVRANQDTDGAHLKPYVKYGVYVPRFLVLSPDGQAMSGVTSGNPEYPHYYGSIEALNASLQAVVDKGATKAK